VNRYPIETVSFVLEQLDRCNTQGFTWLISCLNFLLAELQDWLSDYSSHLKLMRERFQDIELQNNSLELQRLNYIKLDNTIDSLLESLSLPPEKLSALSAPNLSTRDGMERAVDAAKVSVYVPISSMWCEIFFSIRCFFSFVTVLFSHFYSLISVGETMNTNLSTLDQQSLAAAIARTTNPNLASMVVVKDKSAEMIGLKTIFCQKVSATLRKEFEQVGLFDHSVVHLEQSFGAWSQQN
jgi:uncharacterized coiled-coil protein SlyX